MSIDRAITRARCVTPPKKTAVCVCWTTPTLPAPLPDTEGPDTEVGQGPPLAIAAVAPASTSRHYTPFPEYRAARIARCVQVTTTNTRARITRLGTFRLAPNNPQVNRAMLYRLTIAALIVSASAFAPTDQCKARSTLPVPYHSMPQN